ncbi:MAG: MoaD/ThiS family protein [Nitrososphaerales archaeon]
MTAEIKLIGNLKGEAGSGKILISTPIKLKEVIDHLNSRCDAGLRRDSVLILVNGVEANALDDLDTVINEEDEVVFVPMFHGGA